MSNANKLLLHKYVNMGHDLSERQFNKLSPSLKKDYIRKVQTFSYLYEHDNGYILPYLSHFKGNIYLPISKIASLGNLEGVGGYLNLYGCINLTSLGNLREVGGMLDLSGCENLESTGNLKHVGGNLNLSGCENLESLANLVSVGTNPESNLKYLNLSFCEKLTSLGDLEYVGGSLILYDCDNLTSFGNLKHVGGALDLYRSPLAEMYTEEQIREKINVVDAIHM